MSVPFGLVVAAVAVASCSAMLLGMYTMYWLHSQHEDRRRRAELAENADLAFPCVTAAAGRVLVYADSETREPLLVLRGDDAIELGKLLGAAHADSVRLRSLGQP